jgi:hypothetical protein
MQRVSIQLDPLTSIVAFDELCDVVMREYPENRWLVELSAWDVDARTCVVLAPTTEEVQEAFARWCADMGLGAPIVIARDADPDDLSQLKREQGLDEDYEGYEDAEDD